MFFFSTTEGSVTTSVSFDVFTVLADVSIKYGFMCWTQRKAFEGKLQKCEVSIMLVHRGSSIARRVSCFDIRNDANRRPSHTVRVFVTVCGEQL